MRHWLLAGLALLCLGISPAAQAQGLADAIAALPDCAAKCLTAAVTDSSCAPTDKACICADAALLDDVTVCVTGACTIKEGLYTKNATLTLCNVPVRSKTKSINTTNIILSSIALATAIFRLIFKQWSSIGWSPDDWAILVTLMVGIANKTVTLAGVGTHGIGQDIWNLPFDTVTGFAHYFYFQEILYFAEVSLLKMSILLFYLRIFPSENIRRILWATVVLNGMFGVSFVFAAIFQCTPISLFWTEWDGEHEGIGTCVDLVATAWSNAIVSIVFDLWMLAIPLSQLHKLQLHWKRKLGVGLMFIVGAFVTVVSILRLQSLVELAKSSDNPTWYNAPVIQWSVIEINVGLICACMPTIRLALVRAFRVFGETSMGNSHGADYHLEALTTGRGNISRVVATSNGDRQVIPGGVAFSKSFEVEYTQADDSSIMPMNEFDGGRSIRSGSDKSSSREDVREGGR